MTAAGLLALLLTAAPGGVPLPMAEGQITHLQFVRPVKRVALSQDGVVLVKPQPNRVEVTGQAAGKATLLVIFEGGATVAYDIEVVGARREGPPATAAAGGGTPAELGVGQELILAAPGVTRVMVENDSVVQVRAEPDKVHVTGTRVGTTAVILVDRGGGKITYQVRVR